MTIKIEKNIFVDTSKYRRNSRLNDIREVVKNMEIGDSFILPEELIEVVNGKKRASGHLYNRVFRKQGMKCTTRTLPDGSIRCWRVEE